ncbi:MAG: DUF302 domain-containing protein [Euryarchaeota archaeon]|nr:DUF302 domain-containing protein [Euryarchaeota archaeon]
MAYKYVKKTNLSFEEAEEKFKAAVEEVGLKVVAEVMPSAKVKKGLGIDIPPYKVLFICHPKYIYDMMMMDYDIGVLVPCHGVVYERDGAVYVGVDIASEKVRPAGEKVAEYIKEAEDKMKKAVDMVQ